MTLTDVLSERARQVPDRVAFVFEGENLQTEQWTYSELDQRARTVAAWLEQQAEVDDRALLVFPAGLEFIAAYFGCIYAGVLPVPATYPKPRRPLPRLDAIVADCQPRLALTHSSVLEGLSLEQQSAAVASLTWTATDELTADAADYCPVERGSDDLAFLQYTSGSTSEPRGVMVTHGNLLSNLEAIRTGFQILPEEQSGRFPLGVFWLPAYHDMGLIGSILTPIYVAGTSTLLAPTTFLRHPKRWLELISERRADISGAPNFGYKMVAEKTTPAERAEFDLCDWNLAFCGAEPINPRTLTQFAEAFAESGFRADAFYPCYGLAEVTLLVTGGDGAGEPRVLHVDRNRLAHHQAVRVDQADAQALPLVSCGSPRKGICVEIVDPQSRVACDDGQIGEIWIRGGSVARGYWNQDQINQELFGACLSNGDESSSESGHFFRTGDLGFLHEGQLYVTGRLKDVIIIRGRNYYPHDIERTAEESHAAVDMGAAFSVELGDQERLVVVHQIRREHRRADPDEVLRAIRAAIVDEHEIDPHAILLIRPVSLPITSSGKVQRLRCRELYESQELPVVAQWTNSLGEGSDSEDAKKFLRARPPFLDKLADARPDTLSVEIQPWLIAWLTQRANLMAETMEPTTPFAELGIDSLTAVEISQELDQILELQLPPMGIWSCPTAESLSEYLSEQLIASTVESPVAD